MMLPTEKLTSSPDETERLAAELATHILSVGQRDAFIAMYGDLGAGKTAFVRGLASVLVPEANVTSPTYAIVNEYVSESGLRLCHFDMYRVSDDDDLYSIGFYDYKDCVIAAEWCENVPFALPDSYYKVCIKKCDDGDDIRRITISEVSK